MNDRRDLDDAILEMLGVTSQRSRTELVGRLYAHLREHFEGIRQKEELAISNKNRSKRKAAISPAELARQILADVKDKHGDLLRSYTDFVDANRPYSTFDLPAVGTAEVHEDIFARDGSVRFMKGRKQIALLATKTREQAELVTAISSLGVRGLTRVPLAPKDCIDLQRRFEAFITDRSRKFQRMISDRTGDPDLQDAILVSLSAIMHHETVA